MEITVKEYIATKPSVLAKIKAIEALIDAMLVNAIDSIDSSGTASYSMDDGQMKVTTNYRSVEEIQMGIWKLQKLLNLYKSRYNGSLTVLRGRLKY